MIKKLKILKVSSYRELQKAREQEIRFWDKHEIILKV